MCITIAVWNCSELLCQEWTYGEAEWKQRNPLLDRNVQCPAGRNSTSAAVPLSPCSSYHHLKIQIQIQIPGKLWITLLFPVFWGRNIVLHSFNHSFKWNQVSNPSRGTALSVNWSVRTSVTEKKLHHRFMHHTNMHSSRTCASYKYASNTHASCTHANMHHAFLHYAYLHHAYLHHTYLHHAYLHHANMHHV